MFLAACGDGIGLPLIVSAWWRGDVDAHVDHQGSLDRPHESHLLRTFPDHLPADLWPCAAQELVTAVLFAGEICDSLWLWIQSGSGVDAQLKAQRQTAVERIVADSAPSDSERAVAWLECQLPRTNTLAALEADIQWGIDRGRELLGRTYAINLVGKHDELGYTRPAVAAIYVNPLPMLRDEPDGRDIFRGLMLHEFGHHLYHFDAAGVDCWNAAANEGIIHLLNLVADEHLERNLRASNRDFGEKFDRVNAYAFQHGFREVDVSHLLHSLGSLALPTLSRVEMQPGRQEGHVRVNSGRLLAEVASCGHSMARFLRCLRMGLGNRYQDPKVAQALALLRGPKIKKATMNELLAIARQLRDIFGVDTDLLRQIGRDAGLQAIDSDVSGELKQLGVHKADTLQRSKTNISVDRRHDGSIYGQSINRNPDEHFSRITKIEPLGFDQGEYSKLARRVKTHAARIRRSLQMLGYRSTPRRRTLRGRVVDRGSLRRLILHHDPRILTSQELKWEASLFLGVLIDCSGSMEGEKLNRAKHFGAAIAEAVRRLPDIDLRLFGFTHDTIYDAGNSLRPAVARLASQGGNNDAAALWHVAQVAQQAQYQTRVLLMISDGSPAGCSVAHYAAWSGDSLPNRGSAVRRSV